MKKVRSRSLWILGIIFLTAGTAHAQLTAVHVEGPVFGAGGGPNVYGWSFTTTTTLRIGSFGLYDAFNGDGLAASHSIGLWDVSQPTNPLVTALIPSGFAAPLVNGFRYVPISPVVLSSGHEYVVAASYHSDDNVIGTVNNPLLTITSGEGIILGDYRFGSGPDPLAFPENFESGPGPGAGPFSGIGPNFTYTPVPESSTLLCSAVGVLAVIARMVRRQTPRQASRTLS
jgi:hypothetical protein